MVTLKEAIETLQAVIGVRVLVSLPSPFDPMEDQILVAFKDKEKAFVLKVKDGNISCVDAR